MRHKLQNHYLKVLGNTATMKRATAATVLATSSWPQKILCCLSPHPGAKMLTAWVMKAKRSPWQTSKVGQTWSAAGQRYLEVAPLLYFTHASYACTPNAHDSLEISTILLYGFSYIQNRGGAWRHAAAVVRQSDSGRATCPFCISRRSLLHGE